MRSGPSADSPVALIVELPHPMLIASLADELQQVQSDLRAIFLRGRSLGGVEPHDV